MTPTMPRSLRIKAKEWSRPARTLAQRSIRDAQMAAAHAEGSTQSRDADILCYAAELTLQDADDNIEQETRPASRARRIVADAHLYVEQACPREPR